MSSKVLRDTLRRKMTADRRALAMALGCEDSASAISEVANSAANVLLSRAGAVEMRTDGGGSRSPLRSRSKYAVRGSTSIIVLGGVAFFNVFLRNMICFRAAILILDYRKL